MDFFFIKRVISVGVVHARDQLRKRQVQTLNTLLLITVFFLLLLSVIDLLHGLPWVAFLNLVIVPVIIFPAFLLQSRGKFESASIYFTLGISSILLYVCMMAYQDKRFTETENLFIPISLLPLILLDGKKRFIIHLLLILALLFLKYEKLNALGSLDEFAGNTLNLTLVNISVIVIIQFFVVVVYREALRYSMTQSMDQEKTLFSLIDNVPIYLAILDRDHRYIMMNSNYETSFLLTREEMLGRQIDQVLSGELLKAHKEYLDKTIREKKEVEFSEHRTLPNGTTFYAYGKYVPVLNEFGEVDRVTVFVDDVTKLKEIENQLKEANMTKNQLFSIIAHDLKNPLNLFKSMLSLEEELISKEEFSMFKQNIRKRLENLSNTLDNLLEWSRNQMDRPSFNPVRVDLKKVIMESISIYEDMFEAKSVQLDIQAPEEEYAGYLDQDHFKIIFRNLVHNALKYTEKGKITISIEPMEANKMKVIIEDSGIGMTESKLNEIRSGKIKSSEGGTRGEMGTGLGMPLIIDLLKTNHCRYKIESKRGSGTSFTIIIPGI